MKESRRFFYVKHFYWLNALFWLFLFLHAFFLDINSFYYHDTYDFDKLIYYPLGYYFTYWLASFFIVRFYLLSRQWAGHRFLMAHLLVAFVSAIAVKLFSSVVIVLLERLVFPVETLRIDLLWEKTLQNWWDLYQGLFSYVLFFSILYALDLYARYKNHFVWYSELETKLVKNQLQTLKMQLKPHFLFNALNTIAMMVRKGNDKKAVEMITGLSDMLRSSLSNEGRQFVTLAEELDLLKKYLSIEEIRYQDRLKLQFEIEEKVLSCKIPNLILQPIVENAFKHGIAHSMQEEEIKISSKIVQSNLQIEVYNSGSSLPPNWTMASSKGIGMANTALRLQRIYKDNFKFQVLEVNNGVLVRIVLPKNQ